MAPSTRQRFCRPRPLLRHEGTSPPCCVQPVFLQIYVRHEKPPIGLVSILP